MAQIRDKTRSIDTTLKYATRAWASLPEVAHEIPEWEPAERVGFVYDWTVEDAKLDRLRQQAGDGLMDESQIERFHVLQALVEQNRPIIEELRRRYNS